MTYKKISIIFLVSLFFTLLTFLYSRIDFSQIHSTLDVIKFGLPQLKIIVLENDFFKQIPMLPVILGWTTIGIITYLIYYSVQLLYNSVRNWTVVELFFEKAKVKEGFDYWHFAVRTIIHVSIIICYLAFMILLIFILYRSASIYSISFISNLHIKNIYVNILPNGIVILCVWLIFFSFFTFLFYMLNKLMVVEEMEEEHGVASPTD